MLRLSEVIGSSVRAGDGQVIGTVVDLAVQPDEAHPTVQHLAVGRRRRIRAVTAWHHVVAFEQDGIDLSVRSGDLVAGADLPPGELWLGRDVLDTQIVDVAGKRLARVSEVLLTREDPGLLVTGVDVGQASVWRRLGLGWFAGRAAERVVEWTDLHLTSTRGHTLQLASTGRGLHQLSGPELAAVVANLPTTQAAEVIDAVSPALAAEALSAAHPRVGARLLHHVSPARASSVIYRMPVDDATAVLRGLRPDALDSVLGGVTTDRAATLRRLLAHPAETAGGLMNTEVRTAPRGTPAGEIRAAFASDAPELEGLATVFIVDEEGRPIGSYEPSDLLAGREQPGVVPTIPLTFPVERVIDLFALRDDLALPVVDADGRLVGAIAVDDVLEELLAERLPGQRRFGRVRHAAHRLRSLRHTLGSPPP